MLACHGAPLGMSNRGSDVQKRWGAHPSPLLTASPPFAAELCAHGSRADVSGGARIACHRLWRGGLRLNPKSGHDSACHLELCGAGG